MRVSCYVLKSDGAEIARVRGNSRGGYAVTFSSSDRVHALQKARRVRDVVPYVRAVANIWSESDITVEREGAACAR